MQQSGDAHGERDAQRARGRGRYDRAATREQRWAEQHRLLLAATAEAIKHPSTGRTATVVVRRAGVGRNTFYDHFRNVDDAIDEVCSQAELEIEREVRAAVETARTPVERLRTLCRAWCAAIAERRAQTGVLLTAHGRTNADALTRGGALFARLLRATLADAHGTAALGADVDPVRVTAISAAAENVSLRALREGRDVAALLSDLVVRAFR